MSKTILLTGPDGFLGHAIFKRLKDRDYELHTMPRSIDLKYSFAAESILERMGFGHFDYVIHCAQVVKGIAGNQMTPATMLEDNVLINTNVAVAARKYGVGHYITFGSTCMYPQTLLCPMREESIFSGPPEPTNAPYAYAKRLQAAHLQALLDQYGFHATHLVLANLYGPNQGSPDLASHVIPSLIHKCLRAHNGLDEAITVWGTGMSRREFLYIDDAVDAVMMVMDKPKVGTYNVGSGELIDIKSLYTNIRTMVGVSPDIPTVWDTYRPDGQATRLLDTSKIWEDYNWEAMTSLQPGLEDTIESYRHCS